MSFNKALSTLLDSSLSQCDGESQVSEYESDQMLSQIEEDISVNLGTLNPLPTKYIEASAEQKSDPHHSHSKSSATIFQYTNEEETTPFKVNQFHHVTEKEIDAVTEMTEKN